MRKKPLDHTAFRDAKRDPPPPVDPSAISNDLRWWKAEGNEIASGVTNVLNVLDRAQLNRVSAVVTNSRLYGGTPQTTAAGFSYSRFFAASATNRDRLSYNLVQSCIDTCVAKLSKNKPKPYFLTSGGSYKTQRKAKKLNQFVEGIFYEQHAYEKRALALRDSAITGDGLIYVHERHGRVVFDRVMPSELWVDEIEAFYGEPRQMHLVRDVDRQKMASEFEEHREQIEAANAAPQDHSRSPNISDSIRVRESWHLPSGPKAKDGKHVITIEGAVVFEEEWKYEFFPFVRWGWCPRPFGYWSQGAAEQLSPTQFELNELLRSQQIAFKRSGLLMWLIENGSKVDKAHITNEIGTMVTYSGNKPECVTPPVAPPELYAQIQALIQRGMNLVGVSEMNVQGVKPAGLNSGKALREMDDIGSDRFTTITSMDEQAMIMLGRLAVCTARDIAESGDGYGVKVPGKRFLQTIDWSDVSLDDDDYTMQCFPVSSLPNDPSGRLDTVQEYVQAGFMSQDVGMKLLEFPDLQQYESLQNAMEDRLQQILDGIVDDGDYVPPEPWYDVKRAKELVTQYILVGEAQKLEQDRLDMLHDFSDAIEAMAASAQAAAQAQMQQQAAAAQATQAVPTPPPQSDLIPNGPRAVA